MIFLSSGGTEIVPVHTGMELLIGTLEKIWNGLKTITIPIINLSMDKYLLSVLALAIMLRVITIFVRGDSKDE